MADALKLLGNAKAWTIEAPPDTPLLYLLANDIGLNGRVSTADSDNAAPPDPGQVDSYIAIGNAFFAATGVRMRRYPLTPQRVRAALEGV